MKKEPKFRANRSVVSGIYTNLNNQVSKYGTWSTEALQKEYEHIKTYANIRYLKHASRVKLEALQNELAKRKTN